MLKRLLCLMVLAFGIAKAAQSQSIVVSDVGAVYPTGQKAAKDGDSVRIIATISPYNVDSVWAIGVSIVDTQVYTQDPTHIPLYDDGNHDDGLSNDGVYATDWLPVKGKTAYNRVIVFAAKDTFWNEGVGTVGIDNFNPFIGNSEVLYPDGQQAAKNGDNIRLKTYMDDISSYVDVSLMIDNSGSMADTATGDNVSKLEAAQHAADTFLTQLADSDRADLWTFYGGTFRTTSQETLKVALTYNKQEVIDSINALQADQWTPLYDATVEAVRYVDSLSNRIAAAIILTDGVDEGPSGPGSDEYTRGDCYFLPIPVFTIGFGDTANIDTAFLDSVALTSGGKFYIAPNSAQLDSIYREIQTIIAKIKSPKGILKAWTDARPLGADSMVSYFDDGDHDDNMYQDSIWGTSLFTVNTSIQSDSVFLNIAALDVAYNRRNSGVYVKVDNIKPIADTLHVTYPSGKNVVHNGEKVFFTIYAQDTGSISGISEVWIDATQIGGPSHVLMRDDGTGNDAVAGDGIYTSDSIEVNTDTYSGTAAVYAFVRDIAGNVSESAGGVVVDNIPPTITDIRVKYPDGQTAVKQGDTIVISAEITDDVSGVDSVQIDLTSIAGGIFYMKDDGTGYDENANDNVYTYAGVVSSTSTGEDTFTITAYDKEANSSSVKGSVIVDNTPPTSSFTFINLDPDNIYENGDYVHIRVINTNETGLKLKADFSSIDSYYIPSSETWTDNQDGTYDIVYKISENNTRPDGQYLVPITLYDGALNSASHNIILYLDNSLPKVEGVDFAIDPLNDNILNAPDTVIGIATDNKGIVQAEYFIDNTGNNGSGIQMVIDSIGKDTVHISGYLNIYSLSEGRHTVYVHAKDSTGIWGDYASLAFTVDTTPPMIDKVTVVYPEGQTEARSGQKVKITALIKDKITGVDPQTVILNAININGDSMVIMKDDGTGGDDVAGDDVYTAELEVTNTQTGTFNFTIRASDIVPNTSGVQGDITFDNLPPYLDISYSPTPKHQGEVYQNSILVEVATHDTPVSMNLKAVVFDVYNASGDIVYHKDINKIPEELRFKDELPLVVGFNRIVIKSIDHVGNVTRYEDTINYIVPEVSDVVGPEGDTIKAPDGTMLIIPEGALLDNTEIKIKTIPPSLLPPPLDTGIVIIKAGHEITPHGIDFHKPVTLVLPYTSYDLDPDHDGVMNYKADSLTVFYYDRNEWVKVGEAEIDTVQKSVSVTINHLSTFALGVDRRTPPQKVLVYLTRNPFKLNEGTSIVYDLPAPGRITVKIYDLNGDLVRTLVDNLEVPRSGEYSIKWYGASDSNRFHGSGLYIYVLKYESDDGTYKKEIKKPIGIIK